MANLVLNVVHKTNPAGGRFSFPIATGVTLGVGALVMMKAGFLDHWDDTLGVDFVGIVVGGDYNSATGLLTGSAALEEATVDASGVTLMHMAVAGTATAAKRHDLIYCADSDPANFTLTDTTNAPVGYMSRWRSATDADITLFTPGEHLAGMAAATW
jgi:hypothetical protein